ncbi:hypothetical protein BGZ58_011113, partial [Dissophora ornata]
MTKIKPRLIARISCQECRRRKTRCNFDGQGDKCSTCARIGCPCIFAQKNGVVLNIDKVMEENNPHLVHQREKELRARERARLAAMGPRLAPLPDSSIYSKSLPSSSFLSGGPYTNRSSRSSSVSGTAPHNGRSSSTEDLSSVMDRLQLNAFGIAPYALRSFSQVAGDNDSLETSSGESSATESHVTAVHGSNLSEQQEAKQQQPKRNSAGSSPGTRQRSSRSRSVPAVDIQPNLIDLYFQHVHPYVLILHKPSFLRRLHDPKDPVPDFLLAAMYAVASHYAPDGEQDGRRYFEFWLSRLDDTLDKPRLSTIQALLLIIKYQEGVKHPGFYFRTYMYTQMVIVLARELQLHQTTPVNVKLDPESHEVRRRLFWSIFVLDQFISLSQGRTMSFKEVEPNADMPTVDIEDLNDPQEIENILNVVEYIKLAKINHQGLILVRKFLTKAVKPEGAIEQGETIHKMMVSWRKNLPPRLQLAPNMSPHTPYVAMIHMINHTCEIMLQRCYGDDPSIGHLEIAAAAREACSVSATTITVITDDLYTNLGMTPLTYPIRGCYFTIYCLIGAATTQANDIRRGANSPIMFKRSLALLNIVLRESTAVDVGKQVELLKGSVDISMETPPSKESFPAAQQHHYDHRPPLKPILPMSMKYGPRMNFNSSGLAPIRMRKISPKVSGPSSTSNVNISSSFLAAASSTGTMSRSSGGSVNSNRGGHIRSRSYGGDHDAEYYSNPAAATTSSSEARTQDERKLIQQEQYHLVKREEEQQQLDDTTLKSPPSPDMSSLPLSSMPARVQDS